MTDRTHALIVTLDKDYRLGDTGLFKSVDPDRPEIYLPTDADFIVHAISAIKGVASVEPLVTDIVDHAARARVRTELRDRMFNEFRKMFD